MAHYATADFYLPGSTVPSIFLEADRQMKEKEIKEHGEIIDEPVEVPMPFIHGTPGARGPIVVTKDWYVKQEKKRLASKAKDKRAYQTNMMKLIAQRDRINIKLGELDPAKKKDSEKIVKYNVKLKSIEAELSMLQRQSHIDLNELEHGTKGSRIIGAVKRKAKEVKKKVKKFYKTYKEPLNQLFAAALPIAIAGVVKLAIGLIA